MTDEELIARLRNYGHVGTVLEAADRIEALTARVEGLTGALREISDTHNEQWHAGRIARAALSTTEAGHDPQA